MAGSGTRAIHRLSAAKVSKTTTPGNYADGGGLYLQISASGSKSWIFRFSRAGRERAMGLGSLHTVSLADAREHALACRKQLLAGIDPIDARDTARAKSRAKSSAPTFAECAELYIAAHSPAWRNAKHIEQWRTTLDTYAGPVFGELPIEAVDTALVMRVLEPVWTTKPETASRVRGRIESVLDWAAARDYRAGENPARWRGHLDKLLPARSKVSRVKHHAALPYAELPEFVASLQQQNGAAARALELAILTAARTGEVIGAQRREFDFDRALWTIPAERMKMARPHRVPLPKRAAEIVSEALAGDGRDTVFVGVTNARRPLSNMAMLALLKRMGRPDLTVHGFRSTFRDWAAECTSYPSEVAEAALAHAVGDKVEAAYRRGDLFEKRRALMNDWADFCAGR